MIPQGYVLVFSILLLSIGAMGVMTKRNPIVMLMGIELMLNAANINLISFSRLFPEGFTAQVFALFIILVAAAESAIALAIVVRIFRNHGIVDISLFEGLRW